MKNSKAYYIYGAATELKKFNKMVGYPILSATDMSKFYVYEILSELEVIIIPKVFENSYYHFFQLKQHD